MKMYEKDESLPWGGRRFTWGRVQVTVDLRHDPHTWSIELPHSCDEWWIGATITEVDQFIEELKAARDFVLTADICR